MKTFGTNLKIKVNVSEVDFGFCEPIEYTEVNSAIFIVTQKDAEWFPLEETLKFFDKLTLEL